MIDRRSFLHLGLGAGAAGISTAFGGIGPALAARQTIKNVKYGSNALDIYTSGTDNAPVLIYVHGGAWRAGSRRTVKSMPGYFNGRGYHFVSVGYTLHPRANVEMQARQVGQAVGWVRANIARYGGNPSRIALMGHSAGCHLASLATLGGLAPGVRALIANDTGAYDLAYLASLNNGRLGTLYAAPFNDKSKWHNWSPISYAGGGGRLPVLVAWSGGKNRDRISKRFADALQRAGHPVTRFDGRRYNHISIRNVVGRSGEPLTAAITGFLASNV